MKTCECHRDSAHETSRGHRLSRAVIESLGWLGSGLALVIVPKCPACLAAYVAMISGVGISSAMAAGLRSGWIFFCVLALAVLLVRSVRRFVARQPQSHGKTV